MIDRRLYDNPGSLPTAGQRFLLPGPAGVLEALISGKALGPGSAAPVGVVCHPHPLYGGSMDNKVVHMVAAAFNRLEVPVLRFNFRGVGQSSGRFDQGKGEVQDLLAVVAWLRDKFPQAPLWLGGFSFGAFVAHAGHGEAGAGRLLLVAPPVDMYPMREYPHIEVPWLVVQGGRDEIVSPHSVSSWVHRQSPEPEYRFLDEAGHFFHGKLIDLRQCIVDAWGE